MRDSALQSRRRTSLNKKPQKRQQETTPLFFLLCYNFITFTFLIVHQCSHLGFITFTFLIVLIFVFIITTFCLLYSQISYTCQSTQLIDTTYMLFFLCLGKAIMLIFVKNLSVDHVSPLPSAFCVCLSFIKSQSLYQKTSFNVQTVRQPLLNNFKCLPSFQTDLID